MKTFSSIAKGSRKGIAPLLVLAAAFILILAIAFVAVMLITSNGKAPSMSMSTTAPTSTNATESPLLNDYLQGTQLPMSQLTSVLAQHLNSSNQLNVSYSGTAVISGFSVLVDGLSVSIPLNVTYQKYGNSSRFDLLATTPLGKVNYDVIQVNRSVSYTCRRGLGILGNSTGSSNYTCTRSNASVLAVVSNPGSLSSMLGSMPVSFNSTTLESSGDRSYDGMGCVLVFTTGTAPINESIPIIGTINAISYNVSSCLSGTYYVPLNITATLLAHLSKGGQNPKVAVLLKEISIGKPVTRAGVVSLPAPVASS